MACGHKAHRGEPGSGATHRQGAARPNGGFPAGSHPPLPTPPFPAPPLPAPPLPAPPLPAPPLPAPPLPTPPIRACAEVDAPLAVRARAPWAPLQSQPFVDPRQKELEAREAALKSKEMILESVRAPSAPPRATGHAFASSLPLRGTRGVPLVGCGRRMGGVGGMGWGGAMSPATSVSREQGGGCVCEAAHAALHLFVGPRGPLVIVPVFGSGPHPAACLRSRVHPQLDA
jgi:hypothetical protein